jgi:hypothetical protein
LPTERQEAIREQRFACIESFLQTRSSSSLPTPINGSQFHYNGEALYTKDPRKANDLQRAIVGRWIGGTLHLFNTTSPLGRDTLNRAKELEINYVINS